ncbi:MAG: hypothetical protein U0Y82_08995 [Thermoleophilia bacterium]
MGEYPDIDVALWEEIPDTWPGPGPDARRPFAGRPNAAEDDASLRERGDVEVVET